MNTNAIMSGGGSSRRRVVWVCTVLVLALSAVLLAGAGSALAAGAAPEAITVEASGVTRSTATLQGYVNPQEAETTYYFEYGTSAAYGTTSSSASAGNGNGYVEVSLPLSELEGGTTYHYRLVAENENGVSEGSDVTFTTPAVDGVSTGEAMNVGTASATLTGSLEPNELDVHYHFEYGTEETYGSATPSEDAGSASGPVSVETGVSGLLPDQVYHYRLVAENAFGETPGQDMTFQTAAVPPLVAQAPATSNPTRSSVAAAGVLDPQNSPTAYRFLYTPEGTYEPQADDPYAQGGYTPWTNAGSGMGPEMVEGIVTGLRPETTYHFTLQAHNQAGYALGPDATFTTGPATPPIVNTGQASMISQNDATLAGTLDTRGLMTTYGFELGTSTDYGPPTGLGSVGPGGSLATVSLDLTGLQPNTTYHYRIEATNIDGTRYGQDQTFTTPPYPNTFAVPPAPLPFVATPSIDFPRETKTTTKHKPRVPQGHAQKLRKALRACKSRPHRKACEKVARKRYGHKSR